MRELAGRFEPFVQVARTDMVVVYRSRDRNLQRVVAIKALRDLALIDKFARAVRDAAVVADEPHFVKMYDAVLTDPHPYCVMQQTARACAGDRCRTSPTLSIVMRTCPRSRARSSGPCLGAATEPASIQRCFARQQRSRPADGFARE
jgi:hypothetical protein